MLHSFVCLVFQVSITNALYSPIKLENSPQNSYSYEIKEFCFSLPMSSHRGTYSVIFPPPAPSGLDAL